MNNKSHQPDFSMIPQKHLCQSCHCIIEENENFCSICGQKKITRSASLWDLLSDFFSNILTLDSKFVRTFTPLFLNPGKLTNEYLAGKRKLYYTPIRMFLFWMTISFILFNIIASKGIEDSLDNKKNLEVFLQIHRDSLQQEFINVFPDSVHQQKIKDIFLVHKQTGNNDREQWFSIGLDGKEIIISYDDVLTMSPEEIIQKYKIKNYWSQLFFGQFVKAFQKQQGFQLYLLSHLSWIVLFSVPLLALFLKFLYYRQKRLYVEHLVYILHLHTFFFAISSLLITYLLFQNQNYTFSSPLSFIILLLGLYLVISIKKVYKQKAIKTGLKILIFLIAYCIIIAIAFVMFIGLNFLFF